MGRVVDGVHQDVDVPVVIEVGEGGAAANELAVEKIPGLPGHVDELALAVVAGQVGLLNIKVMRVAVGDKQIHVTVVVIIVQQPAPARVLAAEQRHAGLRGHVDEKRACIWSIRQL